jgi:hypothetical protein
VDDARIYNQALSVLQIRDIANPPAAPAPEVRTVVYDFDTDAQGWGGLKDGTAPTVVIDGGNQALRVTIDEAAHGQQEGGWAGPRDFTADDALGGISTLSFWYRVDDPDFNGGNFVLHWIMSSEAWSGGGWYGNGLWGVVIADGQWHQQTADLSILGADAGGWEGPSETICSTHLRSPLRPLTTPMAATCTSTMSCSNEHAAMLLIELNEFVSVRGLC